VYISSEQQAMPLSEPAARDHLHTRRVVCEGFRRDDGLWDVEAHLIDTKSYDFANKDRGGKISAGEPLHQMSIRVTLDLDFVIHAAEAVSDYTPFNMCGDAAAGMRGLIGLRIRSGWLGEARERVGGSIACTHLVELLRPLATAAYQTMHQTLEDRAKARPQRNKPRIIDSCYALASDSPVVKREWPAFYTGPEETE
jgi:hypothetical protein